ncbi:MAG: MATE family efflux transporter [Amaricoccus sp.]
MSDRHAAQRENPFLTAPVGRLFLANALPMTLVLSMGGVLNVVDGIFVGRFIGPEALAAVSLAFPAAMLLSALAALVGGGMSSLMARHLGAGDRAAAGGVFAGAHGLALAMAAGLFGAWQIFGQAIVSRMAAGQADIAAMAGTYLSILLLGAPAQLLLGVQADALRSEGRAGVIAGLSVLVNLVNIGANWLGIVVLGLGVAGSALGTIAAQVLGLALLICVRARDGARDRALLPLPVPPTRRWLDGWAAITRLGLPLCLGLLGIAVAAGVVMLSLRLHAGPDYDALVSAYGIATRLLGLAFLPQMAIALAVQSITGNNAGARRQDRARAALRLAMTTAFVWCLAVSLTGSGAGHALGGWFTDDPVVAGNVARILRPMTALYAASGPILVLALHFQALGRPDLTALLTLAKPWLLTPTLVLALPAVLGLQGLWLAFPIGDAILLALSLPFARAALRGPEGRASVMGGPA